jgi:prophage maintenance system killer protein
MAAIQYLTVQDILWINLQVTGSPQDFRYADLEEATFYQYGYGGSTDLISQAARFLSGFMKKKPLASGNQETAFLGCLAFLKLNGVDMEIEDWRSWMERVANGSAEAKDAIERAAAHHETDEHQSPEVRHVLRDLMAEYAESVAAKVAAS